MPCSPPTAGTSLPFAKHCQPVLPPNSSIPVQISPCSRGPAPCCDDPTCAQQCPHPCRSIPHCPALVSIVYDSDVYWLVCLFTSFLLPPEYGHTKKKTWLLLHLSFLAHSQPLSNVFEWREGEKNGRIALAQVPCPP